MEDIRKDMDDEQKAALSRLVREEDFDDQLKDSTKELFGLTEEGPKGIEVEAEPGQKELPEEPVKISKEKVLEADMAKLAQMEKRLDGIQALLKEMNAEAKIFLKEKYEGRVEALESERTELKKAFSLLKQDVSERGMKLWKLSDDTTPVPGIQIKMFSNEELIVDREEAVKWAAENGHYSLLLLNEKNYLDVLKTGVLKEQPGKIDDEDDPRPFVSLKPYQEEND